LGGGGVDQNPGRVCGLSTFLELTSLLFLVSFFFKVEGRK